MNMDSRTPDAMIFPVALMQFPMVSKGDAMFDNYGVSVPWEDLPERLAEIMGEQVLKAKGSRWGLVALRSKVKPRLYGVEADNSDMVRFRQRLEATNMSIDSGLIGQAGTIHVTFWEKTKGPHEGEIGVSLEAIQINPAQVTLPAFGEIPYWRT